MTSHDEHAVSFVIMIRSEEGKQNNRHATTNVARKEGEREKKKTGLLQLLRRETQKRLQ